MMNNFPLFLVSEISLISKLSIKITAGGNILHILVYIVAGSR